MSRVAGRDLTYADLGPNGVSMDMDSEGLNALVSDVRNLGQRFEELVVLSPPYPTSTEVARLPLKTRTMNCVLHVVADPRLMQLPEITAKDLLRVPNLGTKSLIDLLCVFEGWAKTMGAGPGPEALTWGRFPVPLLPTVVRDRLGSRPAPPAFSSVGAGDIEIEDLGESVWDEVAEIGRSALDQIIGWFHGVLPDISDLVLVRTEAPVDVDRVQLSRAAAEQVGPEWCTDLAGRTVGELSRRGIDACAMLEVACLAEVGEPLDSVEIRSLLDATWTSQVSGQDPRFGFLRGPETIAERIASALASGGTKVEHLQLVQDIERAQARVEELAGQPFDETLLSILANSGPMDGTRLMAMSSRLGLRGEGPVTLEQAGAIAGVTKERIRQLEMAIERRWPRHPIYSPSLDLAIELVSAEAPLDPEQVAALLKGEGLASGQFGPGALLASMELAGRDPVLVVDEQGLVWTSTARAASQDRRATVESVLGAVSSALRPFLVGSVGFAEAVCQEGGIDFGASVRDELDELGAVWLTDQWFWLDRSEHRGHSPLADLIQVILSVPYPEPVGLEDVQEGIDRRRRHRKLPNEIPLDAVRGFIEHHPDFRLTGLEVESVIELDPCRLLNPSDLAFMDILDEAGGVLDRRTLVTRAVESGMNESTASVWITFSPIIRQLDRNLWGLRGKRPSESAWQRATETVEARPRVSRSLGTRWSPSGQVQFAYLLPGDTSIVIGVPSAIRRYISGRQWEAQDAEGNEVGTVVVDEASSWGYVPFLHKAGAREGDVLLASFDLDTAVVELRIVSESDVVGFS